MLNAPHGSLDQGNHVHVPLGQGAAAGILCHRRPTRAGGRRGYRVRGHAEYPSAGREQHAAALTFVNAGGGLGELGNFQITVDLPGPPPTPNGFVEVFDGTATEAPANLVAVPVAFGANLIDGYFGFSLREVRPGDTLFGIAEEAYGNGNLFPTVFEANRNQIANPNLIFPGQALRIPKESAGL
jgi:nucleoid-associated protein YgaU